MAVNTSLRYLEMKQLCMSASPRKSLTRSSSQTLCIFGQFIPFMYFAEREEFGVQEPHAKEDITTCKTIKNCCRERFPKIPTDPS